MRARRAPGPGAPLALRFPALLAALLSGVFACDSSTSAGPVPAQLQIVSGDGQETSFNREVPEPLVVGVTDGSGRPVAGVPVAWSAPRGALDETSVTDADGLASTTWFVDFLGSERAEASVEGLAPVHFSTLGRNPDTGLQDFRLDPIEADVSSGPATVQLSVVANSEDEWGHVLVRLTAPENATAASGSLTLVEGTPGDGKWEGTVEIPQGAPDGSWTAYVTLAAPSEQGCNCLGYPRNHYPSSSLENYGLPSALHVVSSAP